MMGKRLPQVVCRSVVMPEMKNMVAMSQPVCSASMPKAGANKSGIATVDPNIVR